MVKKTYVKIWIEEKVDETGNDFIEEINQNEFMSKKHQKVYFTLNYIEQWLFLLLELLDVFPFLPLPLKFEFL